ncbi:hypothetical protein EN904_22095 [Mesorhizobium sp. M7A.F.Ca.CA.001.07.2.1]|uniref:hypothetical protein n=1 Tax=Mesorhizobium TaxID=68287 RepID=UPI000FCB8AAB|nr:MULTISPECIES: hypothetical protein [Mesorhizobium]MCF6123952.1 hypothetical protein [Mesorhizobium ciceri]MCQ8814950.1 hypothetical protein [Mesorhizobium sp. SEMIA396]RUX69471.1 hypothetical protein EN983_27370 [Mesorhizobium sp. M7A.F.Ca.CA.004.08.2.1]RUX85733.1 hypothetical protein EN982_17890 [Mesorhizobium sp. M7A.F.Ca.CA.004.08.1.1]RUY06233.1 hypothetical protein EN985_07530 [Mesorhizobium sp. M7A.F.Ca.CA.004.04.1.1]
MKHARILATALAIGLTPIAAKAQSMSPMRGEINSFTDVFAVRIFPANPYDRKIRVEIHVYDQDFQPVDARISPNVFQLASQASRSVLVVVPFDGAAERKVRICTESIPFPNQQTQIRAQICGKFFGRRKS